jgi:hypothetical protein
MTRPNRRRRRPEEVVAKLKQARPVGLATTRASTHHPRLPRSAPSAPSGFRPECLGCLSIRAFRPLE